VTCNQVGLYNADAKKVWQYRASHKPVIGEQLLVFTSPLLLSFAIALRITKVTGEIRLG
jgi:hypothetical protein